MKPFSLLLLASLCLGLASALLMDSEHNYIDQSKAKEGEEKSSKKPVKLKRRVAKRRRVDQCLKPSFSESLMGNVCPKDVESLVASTTTDFTLVTNVSTQTSEELNSTELPSFSEWSQKALEEEERRKSEERKRKEELKRQQQLQQLEQQQQQQQQQQKDEEQLRKPPDPDLSHVPPPPNQKASEEPDQRDSSQEAEDKVSSHEQGSSQNQASETGHSNSKGSPKKVSKSATGLETGGNSQNKRLLKNFASLDCGAKVISSSSSAKGASNVLSTSKDEYLLSPCSDSTWFVVELCESMQALRLEVANFELYSGVPHHLRLSLSHNGHQWTEIGQFYAKDEKGEQSFSIKKTSGDTRVFGKLAKLEILDNHGAEHYCPISSFRLFGIAEIELIGEDGDDDDDDVDVGVQQGEQNKLDNPAKHETKEEDKSESESKNIVTLLKEKVDETLERVVGIFTRRSSRQSAEAFRTYMNQSSLVGCSLSREIVCPHCTEAQYNDVYFTLATNYTQLLQVNILVKEQWARCVCPKLYGIQVNDTLLSSTCDDRSQIAAFFQTLFGSSRSLALCNVLAWEQGLLSVARSPMLNDAMKSDDTTYESKTRHRAEGEKTEKHVESAKEDVRNEQQSEQLGLPHTSNIESLEVTQAPPLLAPESNSGSIGVTQQQSVWQKLSTKIKTLERNLTLSTGYLQELSLSYKHQIEDLQRAVRSGVESFDALQKRHDEAKSESNKIKRELEQLTLTVKNINGNLETTTIWTLGIHLTCLFLEVIIGLFFVYGCCFRPRERQHYTSYYVANSVGNGVPLRPGGARRQYTQLNGSLRSEQVQSHEAIEIVDSASVKAETTETEEQGDSDDNDVELVAMKDQKLNDDILYPTEDEQTIAEDVVHEEVNDEVRAVTVEGDEESDNQSDDLGVATSKEASLASNESIHRTDEDFDNYDEEEDQDDYQGDENGFEEDEDDDLMDMASHPRVVSTSSTNDSESSLMRRHHRSKSSSPCRIAQAALTKHVLRNFNPDQAQWIPPKQG